MTDTEILRDVAERIAFAAQFQPSPEIAEETRARAAAIRRVIARVAELERENQTQRDMMQGKDDAIAELAPLPQPEDLP